jgi:hypothetical protein
VNAEVADRWVQGTNCYPNCTCLVGCTPLDRLQPPWALGTWDPEQKHNLQDWVMWIEDRTVMYGPVGVPMRGAGRGRREGTFFLLSCIPF